MENNGDINIKNMNKILLDLSKKNINTTNLEKNIDDITIELYNLDPEKDRHKYNCLSCIYGAFLGDSIGSCCEFSAPSKNNHLYIFKYENGIFKPGEVTDDSEMAISAAFAYIDILNSDPSLIQDLIYYYYCVWRSSGPKDIGHATSAALRHWKYSSIIDTKFNNQMVRMANWNSLANGFLMRISTFITYYYYTHLNIIYNIITNFFKIEQSELSDEIINLYFNIFVESYKNVEVTHPNYECGISSAVFTLMTLVGMVTKDAKKVISIFELISQSKKFIDCHQNKTLNQYAQFTQKKYLEIISDIKSNKPISVYSQMGYYLHGFKLSVYFLYKYPDMGQSKDINLYYDIMCDVCDYGGDTDTNCAIVGAMIGPLIGYKNFSADLFERFIKFYPSKRCQFNSAFMYIYVKYLEDTLLNKDNNAGTEEKPKKTNIENIPEEQKQEDIKLNTTNEKKAEDEIKKEQEEGKSSEIKKVDENNENEKAQSTVNNNNNNQIPNSQNNNDEFKYTAYKLIMRFLNEDMEI